MNSILGVYDVFRENRRVGSLEITQNGLLTVFVCECDYKTEDVVRLSGVSEGEYVNIGVLVPDGGLLKLKKNYSKSALDSLRLNVESGFHVVRQGETYEKVMVLANEEKSRPEVEGEPVDDPEESDEIEEPDKAPEKPVPKAAEKPPDEKPKPIQQEKPKNESIIPPIPELFNEEVESESEVMWKPIPNPEILFEDEDIANACKNAKGALISEIEGITLLAIPISSKEPFPLMPVFCFGDSAVINGREYIIFKSKKGRFIM